MLLQSIPEGRNDRWNIASDFINHWIRPMGKSDQVSSDRLDAAEERLGFRLPIALREWYERLGCEGDIWSVQDDFRPPERLRMRGELLDFYIENQAVWYIGVEQHDLSLDDPPVTIDEWGLGKGTRVLGPSISLLVLQMLAHVVSYASPHQRLSGHWTDATLRAIGRHYRRSDLPPLHLFGQEKIRYEGPDSLIEMNVRKGSLYSRFRSDEARRRFEQIVAGTGFEWRM